MNFSIKKPNYTIANKTNTNTQPKDFFSETKTNETLVSEMISKNLFESYPPNKIYSYYLQDEDHLSELLRLKILKFSTYKDFPFKDFDFIIDMIGKTSDEKEILDAVFCLDKSIENKNIEKLLVNFNSNSLYILYERYIDEFVRNNIIEILKLFFYNDVDKQLDDELSEYYDSPDYSIYRSSEVTNEIEEKYKSGNNKHFLNYDIPFIKNFMNRYKHLVTENVIEKLTNETCNSKNYREKFIREQLKKLL